MVTLSFSHFMFVTLNKKICGLGRMREGDVRSEMHKGHMFKRFFIVKML